MSGIVPFMIQRPRKLVFVGFSIHAFTALGAIAGLLALSAILNGEISQALIWLIICQILDGVDGLFARRFDVKTHAPQINGTTLDLVIDYVTCVVVPVVLMIELKLLLPGWEMLIAGLIFFTSALWFARSDQETEDDWFNGFPASWNLVVPSFIILDISHNWVIFISILFCLAQLTTIKFPHLVKVKTLRPLTLTLTFIYFCALTALSIEFPDGPEQLKIVLVVAPLYVISLAIWRTFFAKGSFIATKE
jgi:phosphatidylcholine synthase